MNPYQPPQCKEASAQAAEQAVMSVRHSIAYSIYLLSMGLLCVLLGILFYQLRRAPAMLFEVSGIAHLVLGMLVRKRAYLEVFENRIEFPSPAFPSWRSISRFESIRIRGYHRWIAKREDFDRFVAWREGASGES